MTSSNPSATSPLPATPASGAPRRGVVQGPMALLWQSASPVMRQLLAQIDRVAATEVTMLAVGESGTGKELVARAIHDRGARRAGPFVAVNCGAIPATLIEPALFGH